MHSDALVAIPRSLCRSGFFSFSPHHSFSRSFIYPTDDSMSPLALGESVREQECTRVFVTYVSMSAFSFFTPGIITTFSSSGPLASFHERSVFLAKSIIDYYHDNFGTFIRDFFPFVPGFKFESWFAIGYNYYCSWFRFATTIQHYRLCCGECLCHVRETFFPHCFSHSSGNLFHVKAHSKYQLGW